MSIEKLSPRQRMINLMYLVLIALLALNVSREVIKSFVTVNDGLEQSNDMSELRNLAIYQDLKMAYNIDSLKAGSYYREAGEIVEKTKDLRTYIVGLKKQLIAETERLEAEVADTIHLSRLRLSDNFDVSTNIMIGDSEDGSDGASRILKEKLQAYMNAVNERLENMELNPIEALIDFAPKQSQAGFLNWEMNNFYLAPLAGSVTILSKLENDVNRFEYLALSRLLGEIDSEDIPIDTVAAQVLPHSNYVLLGDQYRANIFLSAYSTTQEPIVELGKWNGEEFSVKEKLKTELGQGLLSFSASHEGVQNYEGRITIFDKEGNPKYYPFNSEFLVARPAAVISPTKMNVFYRGLNNPLNISVPGIPAEDLRVSISGGNAVTKQGNGSYVAKISPSSPREVSVTVSAEIDGNIKAMGSMKFRTKQLPKPMATVSGKKGYIKMRKADVKIIPGVRTSYGPDFLFELPIETKRFKMSFYSKAGNSSTLQANGSRITGDMKEILQNIRSGDRVEFHDIRAKGKDGLEHKLDPIMVAVR
ncbi:MAG: gliding motility protein GldM [Bacteroidota bacterium]